MCVLAGYIGGENAAPILLDMLRREEGLDAGFYTGIATVHKGELHYRKVVGDVATLLKETDAISLPGNIGIAHSRTPSGGGQESAHPFVDNSNKLAYIANGSQGKYIPVSDLEAIGNRLLEQGIIFQSARPGQMGKYPYLSNDTTIHSSDLMAQLISSYYQQEQPSAEGLLNAASHAYEEVATVIVGLCLHAEMPDSIVAVRHNQPMQIGRGKEGAMYLASTAIAFPEVDWQMRVPPLSGAICRRDGSVQMKPFSNLSRLLPLTKAPSAEKVMELVSQFVQEKNPCTMPDLRTAINPAWPDGVLSESSNTIYELLDSLLGEDKISLEPRRIPGADNQGTVPRTFITFKDVA